MKHLKLFEGYREDIAAEISRHQKELANLYDTHITSVISTLIDDYEFTKTEQDDEFAYDVDYYVGDDVIENKIKFTQQLLDELIRANKKLKLEGLQMHLYFFDYTRSVNINDLDKLSHITDTSRINCKACGTQSHAKLYQFYQVLENNVFNDMIDHDVYIIFTIK